MAWIHDFANVLRAKTKRWNHPRAGTRISLFLASDGVDGGNHRLPPKRVPSPRFSRDSYATLTWSGDTRRRPTTWCELRSASSCRCVIHDADGEQRHAG